MKKEVNAIGDICPIPLVKAKEAIKELNERRRNILLMSYFLEMTDAEIAEVMEMERFSVCRNRMHTLKLIRDMYEEG